MWKRLAWQLCWTPRGQQVSHQRWTHTPRPSVNKAAHCGFEIQGRRHQKSKTEISVAPQKGHVFQKFYLKNFQITPLEGNKRVIDGYASLRRTMSKSCTINQSTEKHKALMNISHVEWSLFVGQNWYLFPSWYYFNEINKANKRHQCLLNYFHIN